MPNVLAVVMLVACSEHENALLTIEPLEQEAGLARSTGRFASADGRYEVVSCPDPTVDFCKVSTCGAQTQTACKPLDQPGGEAPLAYERWVGMEDGCACYGCECTEARIGVGLRVTVQAPGFEGSLGAALTLRESRSGRLDERTNVDFDPSASSSDRSTRCFVHRESWVYRCADPEASDAAPGSPGPDASPTTAEEVELVKVEDATTACADGG